MKKLFLSLAVIMLLVSLFFTINIQPAFAFFTVQTTTTTQLSATSISVGEWVTDTATVAGATGGTVTFYVKIPGGTSFTTYGSATVGANHKATSGQYTATTAGTYYFKAVYADYISGLYEYLPSQSGDTDEPLTVNPPGNPTPEMPAGLLLGIGLAGVGTFVVIKRRKANSLS